MTATVNATVNATQGAISGGTVAALLLAAVTVLLVWPVPAVLARSRSALRHPAPALAAWQVVGLASGLAAIGSGVTFGLQSPLWTHRVVLVAALGFAGYLLAVAARVTVRTLRHRRRHREVLDLVSRPLPELPGGRLLESATAMAYCLPGLRPRMVVTSAALTNLSPAALAAVVAHESAHLAQRHDLVVLPFVAWQTALPFLPGARTARAAVALLVEALADDAARRRIGVEPLGEALAAVAMAGSADYAAAPSVELRLARL
jgi:Zn-dependent protease with chaperone function